MQNEHESKHKNTIFLIITYNFSYFLLFMKFKSIMIKVVKIEKKMSYLSKYIDLVVKLNIIREKLIRYKMIQSIVLLNLWLVIKLIFSIENIFKVLFFLWLLIFRLDFKHLNRSLQRCCISDFDLLRLKLLSN